MLDNGRGRLEKYHIIGSFIDVILSIHCENEPCRIEKTIAEIPVLRSFTVIFIFCMPLLDFHRESLVYMERVASPGCFPSWKLLPVSAGGSYISAGVWWPMALDVQLNLVKTPVMSLDLSHLLFGWCCSDSSLTVCPVLWQRSALDIQTSVSKSSDYFICFNKVVVLEVLFGKNNLVSETPSSPTHHSLLSYLDTTSTRDVSSHKIQ